MESCPSDEDGLENNSTDKAFMRGVRDIIMYARHPPCKNSLLLWIWRFQSTVDLPHLAPSSLVRYIVFLSLFTVVVMSTSTSTAYPYRCEPTWVGRVVGGSEGG